MGKAKVGDTIRWNARWVDMTKGKEYSVHKVDRDGDPYIIDDVDDERCIANEDNYTIVSGTSELDELRAFKAAALARFPALAEPETDEQAIERIYEAYLSSAQTPKEMLATAIEWARANPR